MSKIPSFSFLSQNSEESSDKPVETSSTVPSFGFLSQISEGSSDKTDKRGQNQTLDFSFLTQQQAGQPSIPAGPSQPLASHSAEEPAVAPSQKKKLSLTRSVNTACPLSLGSQNPRTQEPLVIPSVSRGGSSFEHAFSSIKQTKFYEPPADPPPSAQIPIQPPVKTKPRNPRAVLVRLYPPESTQTVITLPFL